MFETKSSLFTVLLLFYNTNAFIVPSNFECEPNHIPKSNKKLSLSYIQVPPLSIPIDSQFKRNTLKAHLEVTSTLNAIQNTTKKLNHDESSKMTSRLIRPILLKDVPWSILPLQKFRTQHRLNEISNWIDKSQSFEVKKSPLQHKSSLHELHETKNIFTHSTTSPRRQRRNPSSLDPQTHMNVIYIDNHIIVLDKPSGILSVPGPNRKPSLANLVFDTFGNESGDVDKMVVHRLDMDTSGIMLYARTDAAMLKLNKDFRERKVKKIYEALVCGHISVGGGGAKDAIVGRDGEIDLPLQRDHRCPPFMRVATTDSEQERVEMLEIAKKMHLIKMKSENEEGLGEVDTTQPDANTMVESSYNFDVDNPRFGLAGFQKKMKKDAKSSLTHYTVCSQEEYNGFPVTRLSLIPVTGRTHQLRVHCAAIGHPILSDSIYGFDGEGKPNGGYSETFMNNVFSKCNGHDNMNNGRASLSLQKEIKRATDASGLNLCLHAKELCIFHPITGAPLIFESKPPF